MEEPDLRIQVEVREAFHCRIPGRLGTYRIVEISPRLKTVHAYRIASEDGSGLSKPPAAVAGEVDSVHRTQPSAGQPASFSLSELDEHNGGWITKVEVLTGGTSLRSRDELNKKQKPTFDKIKKRIDETWAKIQTDWVLDLQRYTEVVREQAEVHGVHRTTLARDMGRFFQCGLDADAAAMSSLLSRTVTLKANIAKGQKRKVENKLGRKRKVVKTGHDLSATGTNVSDKAQKHLEDFLTAVKDRQGKTYAALHREYRDQFAVRVASMQADGFVNRCSVPELDMTVGQFRYQTKLIEDAVKRAIKKVGRKNFDLRNRILTGHAHELIGFPGHTYIIDSTILDIYCVSAVDRRLLIGRPVLYIVIDAFSQAILAVHVALEGPDMNQARIALYLAVSSKKEFLDNLGVRGDRDGCIQGVRPLFVFSDRGELLSRDGRELAEVAQIAQSLAAPYRADWKAMVERPFGVFNQEVIHWEPGAVRKRMRERGDRDHRLDAVLTVNELKRMLWSYVFEWNLTKDMSGHVSCSMLKHEVDACPTAFWHHGLEHLHGSATLLEPNDAVLKYLSALSPGAKRSGLHVLQNMRFTATWMRTEASYYELVESGGTALVYLNPNKPLGAYVLDASSRELREMRLVDQRRYASCDVCVEDVLMMEEYMPLIHGDGGKDRQNVKDSQRGERNTIVAQAAELTKAAQQGDTRSKAAKVAEIKINRAAEVDAGRGLPYHGPQAKDAPTTPSQDEDLDALYLSLLENGK